MPTPYARASQFTASNMALRYTAEASDLGLRPGEWPERIRTDLGNGRPLVAYGVRSDGTHVYRQAGAPLEVFVFND